MGRKHTKYCKDCDFFEDGGKVNLCWKDSSFILRKVWGYDKACKFFEQEKGE